LGHGSDDSAAHPDSADAQAVARSKCRIAASHVHASGGRAAFSLINQKSQAQVPHEAQRLALNVSQPQSKRLLPQPLEQKDDAANAGGIYEANPAKIEPDIHAALGQLLQKRLQIQHRGCVHVLIDFNRSHFFGLLLPNVNSNGCASGIRVRRGLRKPDEWRNASLFAFCNRGGRAAAPFRKERGQNRWHERCEWPPAGAFAGIGDGKVAGRVAHIVQRMSPGGIEVLALRLARQLPGSHVVVSLESNAEALAAAWPRLRDLSGALIGMNKRDGFDAPLFNRLRCLLAERRVDTVVTHHAGPLFYCGPAARAAGVARVIHVEHDVWHYNSPRRRWLMRAAALAASPRVVGVSEKMRAPLRRVFPRRDIQIIPNGVDLDGAALDRAAARARLGVNAATRLVGAVGRLEWVKGHDVLIDAMALLPPDVSLAIIGEGSRRAALEAQVSALGLDARVRLHGHRDDAAELHSAFDVFCQPSRDEGLPLAVLEAQAAGAPVVATNVGDLAAAVCPDSGLLAAPENPAAIAAAIARIMGNRGAPSPRQFVFERFNWRATLDGYAKITGV